MSLQWMSVDDYENIHYIELTFVGHTLVRLRLLEQRLSPTVDDFPEKMADLALTVKYLIMRVLCVNRLCRILKRYLSGGKRPSF